MKLRPVSTILFFFLIITFSGCEKEVVEQKKEPLMVEGEGVKLNVEQKIVDLPSTSFAEVQATDTIIYNEQEFPRYEIQVEGVIEDIEKIEPGTVIYVPTGEKGGLVLLVYEVESTKKSVSGEIAALIKGVQTTLDMYFNYENAIVEFSTPDNRSKVNSKAPNKLTGRALTLGDGETEFKSKFAGLEFTSSPDELCKLSLSANLWKSGDSYISVGGSLMIHPAVDFYMQYEPVTAGSDLLGWMEAALVPDALLFMYKDKNYYLGNMKRLYANIYTDINRDLTFNIHLEEKLSLDPVRIPLGMLVIPTVPVSVNMEAAFEIDFSVMGVLDLEVYKNEQTDIVLGVDLDRDLPDPVWYYEFDQRTESGLKLMAKIELTTGISLILEAEVYVLGVIGPEVSARGFLEATASVTAEGGTNDPLAVNWKLSADAGVQGKVTLNLAAFHIDKATWKMWEMVEKTERKNIYLAPHHLLIEGGNDQIGTLGQPLPEPVTVGAYDSRNKLIQYLPVPLYFETDHGSSNPQGMVLSSEGLASTTWTLDNEVTEQELAVYFRDGTSKMGEVKVTASANQAPTPLADFTASATNVTTAESIQFTDQSTNEPTEWEWDFGDGGTSTQQNPSHTYSTAGTYTISLTATNEYGSDSETKTDYITATGNGGGETGTFTDSRDGKTYNTIQIGNQTWMAENLAYLPSIVGPGTGSYTDPYHYVYGYNGTSVTDAKATANYQIYGVLYNWPAAMQACPAGWHLPTDAEWKELEMYLGMSQAEADNSGWRGTDEGGKLKETGTSHWVSPNTGASNESGFTALPGGYRFGSGGFSYIGYHGTWWSASESSTYDAWYRYMTYFDSYVLRYSSGRELGFSVRCVRD